MSRLVFATCLLALWQISCMPVFVKFRLLYNSLSVVSQTRKLCDWILVIFVGHMDIE